MSPPFSRPDGLAPSVSPFTAGAHAFGNESSYRLGVEEELLLVGADGVSLASDVEALVERVGEIDGSVDGDTFASCVELATPIVVDGEEAHAKLVDLRRAVGSAGRGTSIMGSGVHPVAAWGQLTYIDQPRYRWLAGELRSLLDRTPTCALHVHVGLPTPELAVRVCNGLRRHLPLLLAFAGNSPYYEGVDSGYASARWGIWRAFPRTGVPPTFADYEDYLRRVAQVCLAGGLEDFSYLWWDVRPNPRLGTIEMRVMDAQASVEVTAALASLVHALVILEVHDAPSADDLLPEAITEGCFRAARDGLDALLWDGTGFRPGREIALAAIDQATPWAREAGFDRALEPLSRVIAEGGEARRRRRAHEHGGIGSVVADLLRETLSEPTGSAV